MFEKITNPFGIFLVRFFAFDSFDIFSVNSKIKITKKVGIIITSFGNEKLS